MAIYYSIITPKGGPLNVWQSNLALGTVHWVPPPLAHNLSCAIYLSKCVLQGREDKADIACGFSKLCHLLFGKGITWPLSMTVHWAKKVKGKVLSELKMVRGSLQDLALQLLQRPCYSQSQQYTPGSCWIKITYCEKCRSFITKGRNVYDQLMLLCGSSWCQMKVETAEILLHQLEVYDFN